ncbi:MAG: NAD-dependent epimerase/dehydratase family protein [Myxococcales bacterium]
MRAFVTGGSGFVGKQLIRQLRERGHEVRALARSKASEQAVRELGALAVAGDLDDEAAMREGMRGCDWVFHAAAKVEVWGKREDFDRVTVQGTRRALAAARAAAVQRFVHVSTEAVLVGGPKLIDADETWPLPQHPLGLYPWSKGLAEAEVRAAARDGLHAVIVRPRAIWGAGDTVLLPRLCKLVDDGKFAWIGGGHALTSTCHVKNVCAGLIAAAERGRCGETYFVTDGAPLSYRAYLGGMLEALGRDTRNIRSVPLLLARTLAVLLEAWWRLSRSSGEPPLTRSAVALVGEQVTVNDHKARTELAYRPVISREDGLAELRSAGLGA